MTHYPLIAFAAGVAGIKPASSVIRGNTGVALSDARRTTHPAQLRLAAPHAEPSTESRFTALDSVNRLHERLTLALLTAIRMTRVGAPNASFRAFALLMGSGAGRIRTYVPPRPLPSSTPLLGSHSDKSNIQALSRLSLRPQNRPVAACVSAVTDSA